MDDGSFLSLRTIFCSTSIPWTSRNVAGVCPKNLAGQGQFDKSYELVRYTHFLKPDILDSGVCGLHESITVPEYDVIFPPQNLSSSLSLYHPGHFHKISICLQMENERFCVHVFKASSNGNLLCTDGTLFWCITEMHLLTAGPLALLKNFCKSML